MQASKLQPVLLGGIVMGVLSALPIVNIGNCCCLWVISGGALAAYLLQQNQSMPITSGDGATVGLMAGIVGAVVHTVVSIPVTLLMGPIQSRFMERILQNAGDVPPEMQPIFESLRHGGAFSIVALVIGFMFMLVVGIIFGALGGLLGATMFRKDVPPPPPPSVPGGFPPPFNPPPFNPPPAPPIS
jgi:hypothetical protein